MANIAISNKEHFLPWLAWADNTSPEEFFKYLVLSSNERKKGLAWNYFIFLKDGTPIGCAGAHHRNPKCPHQIEIAYWQDKAHCGHGYINEAVDLIEKEFFRLGALRLYIRNDVQNTASGNVAKRAGFHFEGICLKEEMNPYMNEYRDLAHWSKINPDIQ